MRISCQRFTNQQGTFAGVRCRRRLGGGGKIGNQKAGDRRQEKERRSQLEHPAPGSTLVLLRTKFGRRDVSFEVQPGEASPA